MQASAILIPKSTVVSGFFFSHFALLSRRAFVFLTNIFHKTRAIMSTISSQTVTIDREHFETILRRLVWSLVCKHARLLGPFLRLSCCLGWNHNCSLTPIKPAFLPPQSPPWPEAVTIES